jgi:hypothetical protein
MGKIGSHIRKSALFVAPAALLILSGCAAAPFRAEVTRFQQLPPAQGQSFYVQAANPKNEGGIEFGQYAQLVSNQMRELGYVSASSPSTADLTVMLGYGIDKGAQRRVRDPFYDPYWGHGFYRPYYHRRARFAYGYYDPFLFGGHGYDGFGINSFTVYTSQLDMVIRSNKEAKNLFEGKAEAKSRSSKLAYVVPNLVEAMFTGFPGNSGETVRISVAPEGK